MLLLFVLALFLFTARRMANRSMRSAALYFRQNKDREKAADTFVEEIRGRLEKGGPPPLSNEVWGEISIFVSGHTHAPSLTRFRDRSGNLGALVNSGCWLRQLQPVPAHLGAPTVRVAVRADTCARVAERRTIQVELWEYPHPSPVRLRVAERLAVAGRLPAQPIDIASPGVRAHVSIGRAPTRPKSA